LKKLAYLEKNKLVSKNISLFRKVFGTIFPNVSIRDGLDECLRIAESRVRPQYFDETGNEMSRRLNVGGSPGWFENTPHEPGVIRRYNGKP